MTCSVCDETIAACACPDLHDRLVRLSESPIVALRWCARCNGHLDRCACPDPIPALRTDGALVTSPELLRRFGLSS